MNNHGWTKKTINTHGQQICVYDSETGSRGVVLLSHSILSAAAMWEAQAALLHQGGYRVLAMDTRGHGASGPTELGFSLNDLGNDCIGVLDSLGVARAHFMGLSLGGMIGIGLGIHHTARFESLVICDTRADMPQEMAESWNPRIDLALSQGCAAMADATVERWFGADYAKDPANSAVMKAFKDQIGATSVNGFVGCARAIQKLDYAPKVSSITVRTTFVSGENDGPFPKALTALAEQLPQARYRSVSKAGHLPNVQNAPEFNDILKDHFGL
ncbi:MAG: alpha/beta fold hydrolase [Burkholderiaceae bacterium]